MEGTLKLFSRQDAYQTMQFTFVPLSLLKPPISHLSSSPSFTCRWGRCSRASGPRAGRRAAVPLVMMMLYPGRMKLLKLPRDVNHCGVTHSAVLTLLPLPRGNTTGATQALNIKPRLELTANRDTEGDQQKHPVPSWCRSAGRHLWTCSVQPLPVEATSL